MKRKLTLAMLVMAVTVLYLPLYSQTRLGLHYTQEELNIWKQRAVSGPYRTKNDVQSNSPGDWNRITKSAQAFLANSSEDRYGKIVYTGNDCVPADFTGKYDPITKGENLRDAAFYYLITGDMRYAAAVRSMLLMEASDPLLNFNNTKRWCPGALGDVNPGFIIAEWLTRLMFGYDYIKTTLNGEDKAKLNVWFLSAARYMQSNYDPGLNKVFVNRESGNYAIAQQWIKEKEADASDGSLMYYGGPKARYVSRQYNNRRSAMACYVGMAGIFLNEPSLILSGKRYFKELIMFGFYPTGYYVDFSRGVDSKNPEKGYAYATLHTLYPFADALARNGDTELYDWTTTAGTTTATSGIDASSDGQTAKGLRMHIKAMLDLRNHVKTAYATANKANVGNDFYRIDGVNTKLGNYSVWDILYALPNLYYKDTYIRASYLRTAPGAVAYPSDVQNNGAAEAWTLGNVPGTLFMFGQMEGKVWPYPGKNVTETASVTPDGSLTFCEGGSVVLKANTGANYSYQWRNNGANIPNATSATYTATKSGNYSVEITAGGSKLQPSSPITVTVSSIITPVMTANGSTTFCSGGAVTLKATTGTNLTYQWKKDGIAIKGAVDAVYSAKESGLYVADVMQAGCNTATTNAVKVTVNTGIIPVVTAVSSTTFCEGGAVVLKATTGTGITYQWKKDGAVIPSAVSAEYTARASGNYSVQTVQNNCQAIVSNAVAVVVNSVFKPTISSDGNNVLCEGGRFVLSAPSGTGITYQWQKDGVNIPNATLRTLPVSLPGSYAVTVTQNGCGSALSNVINVINSSVAKPEAIISPAGSTNICSGNSVTLKANTGTGYTYQWKFNGTDIPNANNPTYAAGESGDYSVKVMLGNCQSALSNVVPVAVASLNSKPVVSVNGSTALEKDGSVVLSTDENKDLTYQWKKDGVNIPDATTASYEAKQAGRYTVSVTLNNCQTASSKEVVVTSKEPTPDAGQQVVSFTLINADTDKDIQTIADGSILNLDKLPTKNLNIRANVSPEKVGKVVFHLSGQELHDNTEFVLPYALYRDSTVTNYRVWVPALGSYTLKAIPYSADPDSTMGKALTINFKFTDQSQVNQAPVLANAIADQSATVGIAYSFSFPANTFSDPEEGTLTYSATLADKSALPAWLSFDASTRTFSGTAPADSQSPLSIKVIASDGDLDVSTSFSLVVKPAPTSNQVTSFTLVNADTEKDILTLLDGSVLDLGALPTKNLNIRANTNATTGTMAFYLSGAQTRNVTESAAPYALFGDKSSDYNAWVPAVGSYTLKAKFFSNVGGNKTVSEMLSISFSVVDKSSSNHAPELSKNIPSQQATVAVAYQFSFAANTFSDPDGDLLTYQANLSDNTALPSWLSFDAATRTFSGTAPSAASLSIQVTASDSKLKVSTTFSLKVKSSTPEPVPGDFEVHISGKTTFCEGGSVILTAPKGYKSYLWSTGSTDRKIKVKKSGDYFVKVTQDNSTSSTSQVTTVVVVPLPQEPMISLVKGNLTATSAYSYQWLLNGRLINGAVKREYTPLTAGYYTVLVGNSEGCVSVSKPYKLTQLPDGATTQPKENLPVNPGDVITVYPNPSQHVISISLDIDEDTPVEMTLVTPMGKHIAAPFTANQREGKMDLSNYTPGIYYLKVKTKDKVYFKRVLKQ